MFGQPQFAGVLSFDVTNLEVSAPGGWVPSSIIEATESFELGASFNGSGWVWTGLKNQTSQFRVSYYAEGIGASAVEVDLGSRLNTLNTADAYGPADTRITVPANTLTPGVYRIACVITFPGWPGLTGFFENLVIQIY